MFMRVGFAKISFMEREFIDIVMEIFLKDDGHMEKRKEKESFNPKVETYRSAAGSMINLKCEL